MPAKAGIHEKPNGTARGLSWIPAFAGMTLLVFLCISSSAQTGTCYSEKETEAEHGLRLHSDLEVITLTCRYSTTGVPLQKLYRGFVHRNANMIHGWENTIARAYADEGGSRNSSIDSVRTWLANQKGNESASMGPRSFCKQWADFVPYAAKLTPPQLLGYVRQEDPARPTKKPPCG
ncbi:MAG: hypothetical protein HY053_02665 [Proteobacteria bacterium]|nr:hypothetical protein [Pseudomonadota bacterium]